MWKTIPDPWSDFRVKICPLTKPSDIVQTLHEGACRSLPHAQCRVHHVVVGLGVLVCEWVGVSWHTFVSLMGPEYAHFS